jgi:hypothetical protein
MRKYANVGDERLREDNKGEERGRKEKRGEERGRGSLTKAYGYARVSVKRGQLRCEGLRRKVKKR